MANGQKHKRYIEWAIAILGILLAATEGISTAFAMANQSYIGRFPVTLSEGLYIMLTWLSVNIPYIVFVLCGLLIIACFVLIGWLVKGAVTDKHNKARMPQLSVDTEAKIEELKNASKLFTELIDRQIEELQSGNK